MDKKSLLYWKPLKFAPKDCTWFIGLTSTGEEIECHYACDLSGEEQPPFQGFFKRSGNRFVQVEIIKWRPKEELPK